ncbi:MAG: GNAT family N-acetyltransferase [Candidatus Sericytochromatia bacterium]
MEHLTVATPGVADIDELAAVAARTFPLACPPTAAPENVVVFIDENLSADRFAEYLADDDRVVLAAYEDGRIVGYCMMIRGLPDDADVQRAVTLRPSLELSKMYVLPDSHGGEVSARLMDAVLERAAAMAVESVWLGVNQRNRRAQRFYTKHGFTINGTKTFRLGDGIENDYVMVRPV